MEGNRQIDLGSLTLYDSTPIDTKDNIDDAITNRLIDNIYFVFQEAANTKKKQIANIQSLPQQQQIHNFDEAKLYFRLPEPSILFPRSKKLPEKKQETKWQKFAKQKGIHKKKKTGLKYDSNLGKMVARWGKRSKDNSFQPAIMQQKQAGRNPFQDSRNDKKLKKQKQKLKQLKNKQFRQKNQK